MSKKRLEDSWARIESAAKITASLTEKILQDFPLEDRNVPVILKRQAERYGDKILFNCAGETLTFSDACKEAALWAGVFANTGIVKGDRVAIFCSNRPEFIKIFLGCAWLGAIAVPINTASRGFQLQHIIENSGAKLCCLEDQFLPVLDTLDVAKLPLTEIFVIGNFEGSQITEISIKPLPATGEAIAPAELGPGDPVAILYTSGTTGLSKGVLCPHAQFYWWSVYTARQIGVCEDDILHTTLPLFHVNALGCFFQALLYGATQIVGKRFSVSKFWDDLVESKATITYLLGAMVPMLLSREVVPNESTHNVRASLAPGVPWNFHDEFMDRCAIVLFDGYGATESNAVIGTDAHTYRGDTMGVVKKGFEARVADEHDQPVPDGTAGELLLRADEPYSMASGYFNMQDQTIAAWRNHWLHTGDRVVRDADGYFKFIDRTKDSIRRRGENISSFEVEQVLASHPSVSVAAVFAVDSELGEDEVMTVIVLKDGESLSEVELVRFCETRMSYFSVPRFIDFVEDMPRTESGKIQKYKLREIGQTDKTWDREKAGVVVKR